jgi:hypothetical protein
LKNSIDGPAVYLVPLLDVNWLVYAPFDPKRGYRVDPPKVAQSVGETRQLAREMRDLTDGKFILTPHSGPYCRTGYYEGEMLDVYREAVAGGAELAVHLHEEIKGQGTRIGERDHVTAMFRDCKRRLEEAGIEPVAYRGAHYAYAPFMTPLLEGEGIFIDCSCSPGANRPEREAIWVGAPLTARYLPEDVRAPAAGQKRSRIFEIPIGSDGAGAEYANILHIEQSELDNLTRVWDTLVARARAEGRPYIVHSLFHTGSVGESKWLERFRRFLDMVPRHAGAFVTTREAQRLFDAQRAEVAA